MLKITLITLAFGLLSLFGYSQDRYYYAFNQKVELQPSKIKMLVRFKTPQKPAQLNQMTQQVLTKFQLNSLDHARRTYMLVLPYKPHKKAINYKKEMASFKRKFKHLLASAHPIYFSKSGKEMGVTNEFMVRLKPGVNADQALALHQRFGVKIKKVAVNYLLLEVPANADALTIANTYQKSGLVAFAHPNFILNHKELGWPPHKNRQVFIKQKSKDTPYIPNDTYFKYQHYLHNTGQRINNGTRGAVDADIDAPEAWTITKGNSDIVVAVIDAGVTSNHPDLPNSRQIRLKGSNFAASFDGTDPNDPSPTGNGAHGNACAGIIAATQDNNEGITGIAPNVKIMPIRTWIGYEDVNKTVDAINFAWQNNADIISNSWFYSGEPNPNLVPAVTQAIRDATTKGRNGKGCVVVFAAGNSADHVGRTTNQIDRGQIEFPGNVQIPGVLTVGAIDRFNKQTYYSPSSNPNSRNNQIIDIVAPSNSIWTIDIPGDAGYNGSIPHLLFPNKGPNSSAYTAFFGGTSAATPIVAGVAALVLSINPDLSQQQVFDILTQSADDAGSYIYDKGISLETGHGRVNAFKALKMTQSIGRNCGNLNGLVEAVYTGTSIARINWAPLYEVDKYTIRYRAAGTSKWTQATAIGTGYELTKLSRNTRYEVQVKAGCPNGSFSNSIYFTTINHLCYCQVSGDDEEFDDYITQVKLGSINNISEKEKNGYGNYFAQSTDLVAGQSTELQVQIAQGLVLPPDIVIPPGFTYPFEYDSYIEVWIDFNQNGRFSDEGEQVILATQENPGTFKQKIKVPANAQLGATGMRIMLHATGDETKLPCNDYILGSIEDYTVNIVAPVASGASNATIGLSATIYPNPTSREMNVRLTSKQPTKVEIKLADKNGKKVINKTVIVPATGLTKSFKVNHLKKGLYYMSIQTKEGYKKVKRVMIE